MTDTVYKNSCGLNLDVYFTTSIDTIILCKHLIKKYPFMFYGIQRINNNILIQAALMVIDIVVV